MPNLSAFCIFLISLILFSSTSCSDTKEQDLLCRAEHIMEQHPDSALTILSTIDVSSIHSSSTRAKYALLMSMALDKNYIDTTTFNILQPALDYYPDHGTANEKLGTYYYQARIYDNQGNKIKASETLAKGLDLLSQCSDSLMIARTLVLQGCIFYDTYETKQYVNSYLRAAQIFDNLGEEDKAQYCHVQGLNGLIALEDKHGTDSILSILQSYNAQSKPRNSMLDEYLLAYYVHFGSQCQLQTFLKKTAGSLSRNNATTLNLTAAFSFSGDNLRAKHLLDSIYQNGEAFDTLKYLSLQVPILDSLRDYQGALTAYKDFARRNDSIDKLKFDQYAQVMNDKHLNELKAQKDALVKAHIIWLCLAGLVVLAIAVMLLVALVQKHRAQNNIAELRVLTTELENENLSHRVSALEQERDNLRELMTSQNELPQEVHEAMRVRVEMLNGLLAQYITTNERYSQPYDAWVKTLTAEPEDFMNSNRLAFQASHPRFIQYFEQHGLTTAEINYVCLYAIGLRGKEVGEYIRKRSHVNISSAIRKKLGIDRHDTNIGIYVRKLLNSF